MVYTPGRLWEAYTGIIHPGRLWEHILGYTPREAMGGIYRVIYTPGRLWEAYIAVFTP